MKKNYSTKAGFALIDIVIYIALFAILIGGVSISAYHLFNSSNQNQTNVLVLEEGNFLLAKISWVISQAETITTPPTNASSTILLTTPYDLSLGNSLLIQVQNKNITLRRKNVTSILNNSNIEVSNLVFTRLTSDNIESIKSSFTLTSRAPNGTPVTADFSTINFLHK
ncbi:MAG: hypothetical protein NTV02_03315 [Candidatus Zambryskibacteria bacterium]|nr:hypothetical protein [Candidatus Zambryskibacteria bacterium]